MTVPASSFPVADPMLERVLERLEGPERELLLRCAVPRSFDLETLDTVLMPEAPRRLINGLVELGLVESRRGRSVYRLAPALRSAGLIAWAGDRQALRELSEELAVHWEHDRPEEALYHLVVADPRRAAAVFKERYEEAEEAFDLAGCETLLAILDERLGNLGDELRALRDDYRVRYARRLQSAEDWYRTRRFLEREHVRAAFEDLLAGTRGRVMTLQAPGGMGKTMHLRWLVARLCAVRGIPSAWIDFDAVVPTVALQEPWLVLLAVAEQLNRQVEGSPLTDLLAQDAAEELPRLWRAVPVDSRARRRGLGAPLDEPIRLRLESAINAFPNDLPVVLVLDTLEVASLRTGTSLAPLVGQLRALQDACPAMRLLFAGRFDLEQEVPEHASLFADAVRLPLPPFDRSERESYLLQIRGFTDAAMVATIASHNDGNPFKLSLVADLIEGSEDLQAEDLAAYEQVDLMYLLERVLLRIDEMDVRWVLRYGAMPRQLDRGLLEHSMAPLLAREMQRTLRERRDHPKRGLPPKVAGTWERQGAPEDLDAVWAALRRYQKEASWVTVTGSPPHETLHLHVDVVQPMRRLVRDQEVFGELHERLADEFRRRAEEQPGQRARWTREELYHRVHADPEAGAKVVRRRLSEARQSHVDDLLDDLLSGEYASAALLGEPDDEAGLGDTRPVPPPSLVAELLCLSAWRELPAVRRGEDEAWDRCKQMIVRLDRVQRSASGAVAEYQIVPIRAALALHVRAPAAGHRRRVAAEWSGQLHDAIEALEGRPEQVHALVLLADLLGNAEPEATELALGRALSLARKQSRGRRGAIRAVSPTAILQVTAEHHFREGDLGRGLDIVRRARGGSHDTARFRLQEARFLVAAGQPTGAAAVAAQAMPSGRVGLRARVVSARALLEARRPAEAIEQCERTADIEQATVEVDRETAEIAAIDFSAIAAAAYAAQGATEQALDALERGELTPSARTGAAARRLISTRLGLELRLLGDFRAAGSTLQRALPLLHGAEDYAALVLRMQQVEWLADGMGDRAQALAELRQMIAGLVTDGAPRGHRVRAAIEALVLGEDLDEHLSALCDELKHVQPPSARLPMLRELARVERLPNSPRTAELRRLAREGLEERALREVRDPHDRMLLTLAAADVERVTADGSAAAEVLASVKGGGARVDADWVEAAARAGLPRGTVDRAAGLIVRLQEREPGLAAAAALAVARARLTAADRPDDLSQRALQIAEHALARVPEPTRGHAMLSELRARHGVGSDHDERERARQLYDRLGDRVGVERVDALGGPPAHRPPDADRLLVSMNDLPAWLRDTIAGEGSELLPWDLIRGLADAWPRIAASLELVVAELLARQPGAGGRDQIGLIVDDTRAHVIPWELALSTDSPPADSFFRAAGPREAHAAIARRQELSKRHEIPPPGVLLLTPAGRLEDVQTRGSEDWVARALDAYAAAGFEQRQVLLVDEDLQVESFVADHAFTVLHVLAPFVDAEGGPAIDLLGTSSSRALERSFKSGPGAMHASRFRRMAQAMTGSGVTPLLVLDPPSPLNGLELGVQLCLRNAFAGALFDAGVFVGIVAGGLLPNPIRGLGYEMLAESLGQGSTIADAASRLRRGLLGNLEGGPERWLLGPCALAAFCAYPDLTAPFAAAIDR